MCWTTYLALTDGLRVLVPGFMTIKNAIWYALTEYEFNRNNKIIRRIELLS